MYAGRIRKFMSNNEAHQTANQFNTGPQTARLARLELHGYKTFADKTEFLFPRGITAIVGPNGSGKSNIADAIRWVLGEQSYSVLRGKRTEDMIFSGSDARPRMGMATVSVTFDNSDGWLPVDFHTVVITRRAYRSGENEYYLNGTRVRLKDIQELLAASGLLKRSYAVIGQGLVDQALSLRPEERRILIEEAAGITVYQKKRDQALNRLAEVETNLVRVRDILAEITPRLKRLERQVERVQQYTLLETELQDLLRTWYGYRWHKGLEELESAQRARKQQEERLQRRRRRILDLEKRLDDLRDTQQHLRQEIEQNHARIAALHREIETLLREEAVIRERKRGLEAQYHTLTEGMPALQAHLQVLQARHAEAQERLQALEAEREALATNLEEAQRALADFEAQRERALESIQAARERLLTITTRIAEFEERRRQLETRLQDIQTERERVRQRIEELNNERERQQTLLRSLQAQITDTEREMARLDERVQTLETEVQQGQEQLAAARENVRQAETELRRLKDRYALLERLREEGSGLYAGVRAVINARLPGIVGVIAELIHVPATYERAVEEALGASLQDIVVRRWQDAERAIAFLKRERAGRATFLPLDTIRPPRRPSVPRGQGVIGLASDLIETDEEIRPVVDLLLNRTLVVKDLPTARRILPQAGGLRIVTLEGDLVRSTGRVTGGQGKQSRGGMLAREREWRELPQRLERAQQALEDLKAHLRRQESILNEKKRTWGKYKEQQRDISQRLRQLRHRFREHESLLARTEGMMQAQISVQDRLDEERKSIQEELREVHEHLEALRSAQEEAKRALTEAETQLHRIEDDEEARSRLAYLQSLQASLDGRIRSARQMLETLAQDIAHQVDLIRTREEQISALQQEIEETQRTLESVQSRLQDIQKRLAELEAPMREAENRLSEQEQTFLEIQQTLEQERRLLHQEESHLAQIGLAVQRAEDALARLRSQIEEDLGLVRLEESTNAYPAQTPLPFTNGVATLPKVTQIPKGLEEDIRRIRIRLRNLGPINPEAPKEYEQLRERHDFLQTQIEDLTEASRDLKNAIAELDRLMQEEFKKTYRAIAGEFKKYFQRLFGGGTARLTLTNPDDLNSTGIDIIARPPGKRTQSLSMLSGGERALTAAALIFAILTVSPPPFCILDEVDAALDEANVGRFREVLKELAQSIQFIVITHNRGTIEAADTIYGVSMGRDGASRVISLRLEELQAA